MTQHSLRRRCFLASIAAFTGLMITAPAHALFPMPTRPRIVVDTGDPDPIPEIPEPPPVDPPCHPTTPTDCDPPVVNNTPEPATMISAALGALTLAGYARWRNRRKLDA